MAVRVATRRDRVKLGREMETLAEMAQRAGKPDRAVELRNVAAHLRAKEALAVEQEAARWAPLKAVRAVPQRLAMLNRPVLRLPRPAPRAAEALPGLGVALP